MKQEKHGFPVGFYDDLHPDFSINFQMNRMYNWTNDEDMLSEMRAVAPSIGNYETLIEIFLQLGREALAEGKKLKAANYLRVAEFYIPADHPQKQTVRKQALVLMREHYNIGAEQHKSIPYENASLSAYRFAPEHPKGTIVFFGGFDSYIEEVFRACTAIQSAGYELICFEGPGQGSVLEDGGLPMTPDWEKPVKAVLDYFDLNDVTLIGMSLGGCLVLRAAAFEQRVKRVIAYDVYMDSYNIILASLDSERSAALQALVEREDADTINNMFGPASGQNLMLKWAIGQAMHITHSATPYAAVQRMRQFHTRDVSPQVTQDVLLMAGQHDHYVEVEQLFEQGRLLTNARSLTMRLFTKAEHAHNHCQLGNVGLAIEVMLGWIEERQRNAV